MNEKIKFEGLSILKPEEVYSLIVGALEGGSNYWYQIDTDIDPFTKDMKKDEVYVDRFLIAIQEGHPIVISDVETDEKLGELTSGSWAKAEQLMGKSHRRHLGDVINGNDDATTADVFFQLAVMGEVVYG